MYVNISINVAQKAYVYANVGQELLKKFLLTYSQLWPQKNS